jgi:hypothetical protein
MHMRIAGIALIGLVAAGLASADETGTKARFAAPKRVRAGDAFLGEGRLYPSPVLHDADGDGLSDIVVGDLIGQVTFAPRAAGKPVAFGVEKPFADRDGKQLKFHNW